MSTSKMVMKGDKDYTVLTNKGTEVVVRGRNAREALGIFMKRGRFGLGAAWSMTRQKNGWIVVSPSGERTLERKYYKVRETEYDPSMKQSF
jgi:hypothetical protein